MKLVPDDDSAHPSRRGSPEANGQILYYRDPKAPGFKSDKPGINPETGSNLEPVYERVDEMPRPRCRWAPSG
jgi:hypothetical protein